MLKRRAHRSELQLNLEDRFTLSRLCRHVQNVEFGSVTTWHDHQHKSNRQSRQAVIDGDGPGAGGSDLLARSDLCDPAWASATMAEGIHRPAALSRVQ